MIVGVVMTFLGFLGCCGAFKENLCLIGAYIFFLITLGSVCVLAVWWSIHNGPTVRSTLKTEFRKQIKEIYSNDENFGATKIIVDRIQKDFACCGDKGIYDWHNSRFNTNDPYIRKNHTLTRTLAHETGISSTGPYMVPESCCKTTLAKKECDNQRRLVTGIGETAVGLNKEGCSSKIEQLLEHKWKMVLLVAVGLIGIQILAFVFSCCLCIGLIRRSDEDNLK